MAIWMLVTATRGSIGKLTTKILSHLGRLRHSPLMRQQISSLRGLERDSNYSYREAQDRFIRATRIVSRKKPRIDLIDRLSN